MHSLLNPQRPPVFCPGCSHDVIVKALDRALTGLQLPVEDIVIVSDIGCSGLFDTFFNTHAFHGLHGRALTYATGIKLAQPHTKVIVTMGDGGLGIGGAHVLSTCRRNIDLTLLVLNNFNYGMTGGQCSSTTPREAVTASGFLNHLEEPLDICRVAGAAGADWVGRVSAYQKDLVDIMQRAIAFEGFSIVDIWGICPGRYTRGNTISAAILEDQLAKAPAVDLFEHQNARIEYGRAYRQAAAEQPMPSRPMEIPASHHAPQTDRQEILLLGSAGQRVVTAGEILCLAGATAGWHATQKNDYPITVLRGHSVSEVILSPSPILYTGISSPSVIIALGQEGVRRRQTVMAGASSETLVLNAGAVDVPAASDRSVVLDCSAVKIKPADRALAAIAWLACRNRVLTLAMLRSALELRFTGKVLASALRVVETVTNEWKAG
jgi:2-oxoglutarate ferredoxin oxidoreductase subunit beta